MQITFDVTHGGTSETITTNYSDTIALEEEFGIDGSELQTRQRFIWLAYMAWHALKRLGKTDLDFTTWKETVEALDPKGKATGKRTAPAPD